MCLVFPYRPALLLRNFEILFLNTQNLYFEVSKISKQILEVYVANDVYYEPVKSQYELIYILGHTKIRQIVKKIYIALKCALFTLKIC
jgi:hypothetical protein